MTATLRVMVLGGYGGFGARISRRLAETGHDVLVAGRSLRKAEIFCAGHPHLQPHMVDRNQTLAEALAQCRPDVVVDAAGPFQGADYTVARACIAAGVHYFDIADGRAFVAGIGALNAAACAAGVTVISGASSVPALSGAVVRELTRDMTTVSHLDIAISASNRATAGSSVAAAILSYVGKPLQVWDGGNWLQRYGWQDMHRLTFSVAGQPAIRNRLVAVCDVPDLLLFPRRLRGAPAVNFRAGTELALHNRVLWLLSWGIRRGWIDGLPRLARAILPLQHLTARLGTNRSAMMVEAHGRLGSEAIARRWTLIANNGDGPEIPAIAVPLLIARLAPGALAPGSYDAHGQLTLADFQPAFAQLAIAHATVRL